MGDSTTCCRSIRGMSSDLESDSRATQRSGRALVAAAVAAGALFLAYFVAGMPGMDHGPSRGDGAMASIDHGSIAYAALSADDFATGMSQGAFVVNVHQPYEGEIEDTDAFIAYDEITGDRRLPSDTDTPILLYCKSGRMSGIAARALAADGYTDVAHLKGGMDAWEAARMPLRRERPPAGG